LQQKATTNHQYPEGERGACAASAQPVLACLLSLLLLFPCACTKKDAGAQASSNFDHVSKKEHARIVSLAPNLTEMLFLIGAGDRVVGRSSFCDFPAEVSQLPVVGGGINPDLEAMLSLKPDLVVCLNSQLSAVPASLLEEGGVELYWSRVEIAEDVVRTLQELGTLAGGEEEASRTSADLQHELNLLSGKKCDRRVLFVHGHRPIMSAGKGSWGHQLIELAGYVNALGDVETAYPALDLEQVMAARPDFIIDTSFVEERKRLDEFWTQFESEGKARWKVLFLSDNSLLRPGPRVVDAVRLIRERLADAGGCTP